MSSSDLSDYDYEKPSDSRYESQNIVLNAKAAKAREAFVRHHQAKLDGDNGGRITIGKGHVIEAEHSAALQFFTVHHDYRRGKIRESFVPVFPTGNALYENATLEPGLMFEDAMYGNHGISCTKADGSPLCPEQITDFSEANVHHQLLVNLKKMRITQPLPIQCFLIPFLLNYQSQDIVVSAPTGSGKTVAVMLPLIELCLRAKRMERTGSRPLNAPFAIIVGATRDLVHQLCLDGLRIANETGVTIKCAYGEYDRDKNVAHIKEGCDILVATVGRFVDLVDKEDVLVGYARYLAVDEADKLVMDEIFQDLMLVLKDRISQNVVHALFSATFNNAVQSILPTLLRKDFVKVVLFNKGVSPTVSQKFFTIEPHLRKEAVLKILMDDAVEIPKEELTYDVSEHKHPVQYRVKKTIIYGDVRRIIDYLAIYLSMNGIRSISMHGGRSQNQRNEAWQGFTNNTYLVLCASNVAGRGLNFPGVKRVINFDPPLDMDTYVHRIGRAGRLGDMAEAITYMEPANAQHMQLATHIVNELKRLGQPIPKWLNDMANLVSFGTTDDLQNFI